MTRKDELLALADQVEKLAGPDREVDRSIMQSLSLKPDYSADWGPRDNCQPAAFAYTASIDAAMLLVLDHWYVKSTRVGDVFYTEIAGKRSAGPYKNGGIARIHTAAALRAIASQEPNT